MKIAPHIDRFGDIRKMLVDYFQNVLLKKEDTLKEAFFKAVREKYGNPVVIAYSDAFRPLIPIQSGHLFRFIPAGHSDAIRPPLKG